MGVAESVSHAEGGMDFRFSCSKRCKSPEERPFRRTPAASASLRHMSNDESVCDSRGAFAGCGREPCTAHAESRWVQWRR
jgi:hypothetical protein